MTSVEQTKFRQTKAWKEFRKEMLKTYNNSCQRCGSKYVGARKKMLHIHHMYPQDYDDLNREKFLCICSHCHDGLHVLQYRLETKPWDIPPYLLDNYLEHLLLLNVPIDADKVKEMIKDYYDKGK